MSDQAVPESSAPRDEAKDVIEATTQQVQAGSILIVNSDSRPRTCLQAALEADGYRVETCNDGEQALRVLSARPFVLVITAIEMPKIDGLELVRIIRQRLPDMPVIAVSDGRTISQVYLRGAVALGAVASHSLPEARGTLLEVVRTTLAAAGSPAGR